MEYTYTDLMTGEDDTDSGTYSAIELVHEHQRRWILRTAKGTIVLRRMPLRMQRIIEASRKAHGPRTRALLNELANLRPFMEGLPEEEIDQETRERAMDLTHQLMLQDLAPLGVIVTPELNTIEDYDDLLRMLTPQERIALQEAVAEMASVRPASEIDTTPLEIAERLGINEIPEDMIKNLTVSQAEFFINRITEERKAIERMQRGNRP